MGDKTGICEMCGAELWIGMGHTDQACRETALTRQWAQAEGKAKALELQNSELRIHLKAMCDEIGDPARFKEARELALVLLGKSLKPKCGFCGGLGFVETQTTGDRNKCAVCGGGGFALKRKDAVKPPHAVRCQCTECEQAKVCDSCGWNNGPEHGGGSRVMYTVGKVTKCGSCLPTTR